MITDGTAVQHGCGHVGSPQKTIVWLPYRMMPLIEDLPTRQDISPDCVRGLGCVSRWAGLGHAC
jgi:hypothetical protein